MLVAVVGSRRREDRNAVEAAIAALPRDSVIVSGGCRGPDQWAAAAARARGLQVIEHLPDLTGCRQRFEFTKRFQARNQAIVDDVDQVIAFPASDRRGGTEDTIRRAEKAGKLVILK